MPIDRLITAVRKMTGFGAGNKSERLHPPDQLRWVLERERARADRTGEYLSLVAFAPRCPETAPATHHLLPKILRRRLRAIDEIGWLDGRQIAVILPATPAPGAWKVADDVCLEVPADVPPPICTVFSYPLDPPPPPWEQASDQKPAVAPDVTGKPTLGLELLLVQPMPAWKRALDVAAAASCLVLFAPVFGAVAAAVKLSSPGPVLFRQRRSGRGGPPFEMYKFRTMIADAERSQAQLRTLSEQDGPAFKLRHDPRVTRVGRFLRRTSLDELPQIWNVLKGDMSLVGPRPLPCEETNASEGWHRQRLSVTPGVTCIWQVKGRSRVSFAEWVRMDIEYIRSASVWQDLKLLLMTVPAVVSGKGAQ